MMMRETERDAWTCATCGAVLELAAVQCALPEEAPAATYLGCEAPTLTSRERGERGRLQVL